MWQKKPSRRDFLRTLGLVTGAGSLGLLGCTGEPQPGNGAAPGEGPGAEDYSGPTPTVVVRRDVTSPEAQADLEAYAQAVEALKAASGSVTWQEQALIHQNHCPHGNAFFLPWHRGYLHYFERICRELSGKADFALPYWNWSTQATIPAPFWQGTLNDTTRRIGQNTPMPPGAVGQSVIDSILAITDFQTFGSVYVTDDCASDPFQRSRCGTGELEGIPHNTVHGFIGGNMGTFMSPLDPIFWLHHCNVDRLWMEWNQNNQNPNNPDWSGFVFEQNFVDPEGQPQDISVEQTFSTQALGYRYDTQPEAESEALEAAPSPGRVVASAESANAAEARHGEALRIPVELTPEVRERLQARLGAEEAVSAATFRLTLGGVPTPSEQIGVQVFVGAAEAPEGTEAASHVGTFTFFPIEGEHAAHENHFLFDIGEELAAAGWDGEGPLPVHVRSVPLGDAAAGEEAVPTAAVAPKTVRIEIIEPGS